MSRYDNMNFAEIFDHAHRAEGLPETELARNRHRFDQMTFAGHKCRERIERGAYRKAMAGCREWCALRLKFQPTTTTGEGLEPRP